MIWLSFQECTGCTESLTRSFSPTIEDMIFNLISLDYQETLMAASGAAAEEAMQAARQANKGKYVLVVDGSVSTGRAGSIRPMPGTVEPADAEGHSRRTRPR